MNLLFLLRLLRYRSILAARDRWTRQRLLEYQDAELRKVRAFALSRSAFYRRFHKGLESAPLEALPVLTKDMLMENFDSLATVSRVRRASVESHLAGPHADGRYLGRYRVSATSGTTGRKGHFLFDTEEWLWVLASYARASDFADVPAGLFHRLRLAVVSTRTPWHQSAQVGASLRSRWVPALRLDSTDPIDSLERQLNAFRPDSLVGYATMLGVLAESQLAGRLAIHPRAVFSASEVLTPELRRGL